MFGLYGLLKTLIKPALAALALDTLSVLRVTSTLLGTHDPELSSFVCFFTAHGSGH
jgi:hypothetical protein